MGKNPSELASQLTLPLRERMVKRFCPPRMAILSGTGRWQALASRRGLLVFVFLAVRLIAPSADPPPWLSWSTGIFTDEGFYTLDARHEALFGAWAPGNFHDRLLSPLLSLLQQGMFALFGPRLLVARLLCVTFGLLTLVVFWLGLRRVWGVKVADWGTLFLGLAPPFVFYNRLALQETPTVFWLVLSWTLWTYGRPWLLALAGAAFGLAVIFKPLALLALPAIIMVPLTPFPGTAGTGRLRPGLGLFLGLLLVVSIYALLWYAPHHAELSRMAMFYRVHQMQPHTWGSVWLNVRRGLTGGERGVLPYLLALLPVPCLLAGWGMRPLPPPELGAGGRSLTLWLLCGLAFCLLSSYAPSRYYVLFLPPLAGLAALGVARLRPAGQAAAIALFLLTSGFWYVHAWTQRTEARQDAAQRLARVLRPGSLMVGEFAPALCLDTRVRAAPVQPGLSNDDRPVERLHADYVCVTRAPVWQHWWQSRYPDIVQPSHLVATVTLGGGRREVVDVYTVEPSQH